MRLGELALRTHSSASKSASSDEEYLQLSQALSDFSTCNSDISGKLKRLASLPSSENDPWTQEHAVTAHTQFAKFQLGFEQGRKKRMDARGRGVKGDLDGRPLLNRRLGRALLHRQFLGQRCCPSSQEGDFAALGDGSAEDREKGFRAPSIWLGLRSRAFNLLKNRLELVQGTFDLAIGSHDYGSHYQGVYPVKCNQDRFVVEDIVKFGSPFRFGLEAGSKLKLGCERYESGEFFFSLPI